MGRLLRINAALVIAASFALALQIVSSFGSSAPDSRIFGTNMGLYDGNEQMFQPATQSILEGWHTPTVRMPFRSGLSDGTELQALNTIKTVGATPLVIVHGAVDANVLTDDQHLLSLTAQVFGSSTVYVEYGNEEDLIGVNDVTYTNSWNAVVPALKQQHPTYQFMGPVNFHADPTYIGYFVGHANPAPDVVSWHEYTCGPSDSTSTCMNHIANWSSHVANTNAAEVSAVGHAVPFMITEWNMDYATGDARYSDPSVIGPWTTQALQALNSLVASGLVGAQQYVAANHGDFALINSAAGLTPQGQAFTAAMSGVSQTPSPSPSSSPSPSASPSLSPVPNLTSNLAPGSVRFDFEDATAQAWGHGMGWGAITAMNSATHAYSGSQSLAITSSGGYQAIGVRVGGLTGGTAVTYHIWAPQALNVIPFVTDTSWHNTFAATVTLQPGWNTVTWTAANVTITNIGLQVNQFSGTIYLDAVGW
jgi:hypothetical protein